MLQVVFGKFYRQIKKNTMMTSSWHHFMLLEFENHKFCQTGFRLSSLQVSNLLVVWMEFYGGYCKTFKNNIYHYDIISYHCVFKLAYFLEHNIGYQPSKFQCSRMSGSNYMDADGKDPLPPSPRPSATMR